MQTVYCVQYYAPMNTVNYFQYIFITALAVETCNQLVIPPAPLSLPFPPSYPPQHIPPSPHPNQVFLLFFVQHIYWYSFIFTESPILPLVLYLSFSNSTAFYVRSGSVSLSFHDSTFVYPFHMQSIQCSLSLSGSLSISRTLSFLLFSLPSLVLCTVCLSFTGSFFSMVTIFLSFFLICFVICISGDLGVTFFLSIVLVFSPVLYLSVTLSLYCSFRSGLGIWSFAHPSFAQSLIRSMSHFAQIK